MSNGHEGQRTPTDVDLWGDGGWWGTSGEDGDIEEQGSTTFPTKASTGVIERLKNRIGKKILLRLGAIGLAGAAVFGILDTEAPRSVFAERDGDSVSSEDTGSAPASPYELPPPNPDTVIMFENMSGGECSSEVTKIAAGLFDGVFQEEVPSNYEDLEPLTSGALRNYNGARNALDFVDLTKYPDFKDLYLDANSAEPKIPIDQYKKLLTLVLAEVGMDVDFPEPEHTDASIEDNLRKAVMGIVIAVTEMPKITINNTTDDTESQDGSYAGIKTIKLSANPQDFIESGRDTVAYVYLTGDVSDNGSVSGSFNTMTINIMHLQAGVMQFKHAFLHEHGHIDHADSAKLVSPESYVFMYCLTAGFKGANPADFSYDPNIRSSMSNIESPFGSVTSILGPNKEVVTISPYGGTHVKEDVAEVAYAASSPNRGYGLFELQSDNTEVVYKKLSLYIAQIIAEHPESTKELTQYYTALLRLQHMKEIARMLSNNNEAMRLVSMINQTLAPSDYTGVG